MSIVVEGPAGLAGVVGESAVGDWFEIAQERIDGFAEVTEDRQWIHVDPARAAAGPFGTTLVHGYLTLSLIPRLTEGLVEVRGSAFALNAGLDRVRFIEPVPAGARVRAIVRVAAATETEHGWKVTLATLVEREGAARPALAADCIALFAPE